LLAQRGDLPRARSDVQELLDSNPKSADVRRLAAAVAGAQGRTEARLKHLERAQALAPSSATAIDRARTLIRLGRLDDGLAALRAWVDRHPDDTRARAALAEQLLAAGRMKPAIRAFSDLPEDMRMRATVQNNLAWAKLKAGQADAALAHAKRAAERSDGDPRILDTKGMVLLALDRPDAARRVLAKAHAGSERPDIALHYAKALARSGAQDKARELLGPVVSAGHLENGAHDEARKLYRSLEN
jgi:tetratricopeptide (TPR) repeat protein